MEENWECENVLSFQKKYVGPGLKSQLSIEFYFQFSKFQFTGVEIRVGREIEQAAEWPPIEGLDHGQSSS